MRKWRLENPDHAARLSDHDYAISLLRIEGGKGAYTVSVRRMELLG